MWGYDLLFISPIPTESFKESKMICKLSLFRLRKVSSFHHTSKADCEFGGLIQKSLIPTTHTLECVYHQSILVQLFFNSKRIIKTMQNSTNTKI